MRDFQSHSCGSLSFRAGAVAGSDELLEVDSLVDENLATVATRSAGEIHIPGISPLDPATSADMDVGGQFRKRAGTAPIRAFH